LAKVRLVYNDSRSSWTVTEVVGHHNHRPQLTGEKQRVTNAACAEHVDEKRLDGTRVVSQARTAARKAGTTFDIDRFRNRLNSFEKKRMSTTGMASAVTDVVGDTLQAIRDDDDGFYLIHLTGAGGDDVYVALLPGNDGSGDRHVPMRVPVDEVQRFRHNADGAFCILNHEPNTNAPPTWLRAESGQSLIKGLQFQVRVHACLDGRVCG
jgi:hypothetical protein